MVKKENQIKNARHLQSLRHINKLLHNMIWDANGKQRIYKHRIIGTRGKCSIFSFIIPVTVFIGVKHQRQNTNETHFNQSINQVTRWAIYTSKHSFVFHNFSLFWMLFKPFHFIFECFASFTFVHMHKHYFLSFFALFYLLFLCKSFPFCYYRFDKIYSKLLEVFGCHK